MLGVLGVSGVLHCYCYEMLSLVGVVKYFSTVKAVGVTEEKEQFL